MATKTESANGTATGTGFKEVRLPQGTVRYRELGSGEPLLFVHGLLVDSRLWEGTAQQLAKDFRCFLVDWPMGSHQVAMNEDADLSPPGMAEIVAGFIEELELGPVTVIGNDSGGAISQILATRRPELVGRLILTNCDTYEHFPPFPFNAMPPIARLPGGMTMLAAPFRLGPVRRTTYGWLAKHQIDPALVDAWIEPSLRDDGVKRDTRKFTAGAHKRHTIEAAEGLKSFERPVLLAWAPEDRFFKLSHAERLAEGMPDVRIEQIADAGTFVALDQPERLAEVIGAFVRQNAPA